MPDLGLVPTADLVEELVRRHVATVIALLSVDHGNSREVITWRWSGSHRVARGLLPELDGYIAADLREKMTPP